MDGPLLGANWKWNRAVEHLNSLYTTRDEFLKSKPYEVTIDFEAHAGCYVARMRIYKDPSERFSLIAGDLIHNLRSALDHAAWQLARIEHSEKVLLKSRQSIYFPITYSIEEFEDHPLLGFIPEPAKTVLAEFQPYRRADGPEGHWLARLNRLWNADKHRVLHAAFLLVEIGRTGFQPEAIHFEDLAIQGGPIEITSLVTSRHRIEHRTEIAHIRFRRGPDPQTQKVNVKTQPPAHIVLGSGRDMVTFLGLGSMAASTGRVLRLVEPLFS